MQPTVTEEAPHKFVWIHGSLNFDFGNFASSHDDEASDEELAIEASSKGPFGASPTMSMIGNLSPSIAKANISWIFNQVNDSEDELARANVGVVCK
jgi:hypothetical protein